MVVWVSVTAPVVPDRNRGRSPSNERHDMTAYDVLLGYMQEMANRAYHTDRTDNDRLYRADYEWPPDDVNDRLIAPLKNVLCEVRDRIHSLAARELDVPNTTSFDHLRSLALSVAANEIDLYIEAGFCAEPIETRVPEEACTEDVAHAIMEHFDGPTTKIAPHFMYDASTGCTVGIYFREKVPLEKPTSGHTRWVFPEGTKEKFARMRDFGANVKAKRQELGNKVKHLAMWVEIHPRVLREIEAGGNSRVGGTELRQGHWLVQRLAEYLNTTPETLWPWSDDKEKDETW